MFLWPYIPESEIVEGMEWATDVIRSRNSEQRLCLRPVPRQEFEYAHRLTSEQYGRAKELVKKIGADECYLPVWSEMQEAGALGEGAVTVPVDPDYRCYSEGGYILIWDSDLLCEVVEIQTLGSGSITLDSGASRDYLNAAVAPIRLATLEQDADGDRSHPSIAEMRVRFKAVTTEDLSAGTGLVYPTYLTYPVVTECPLVDVGGKEQFIREIEELDTKSGKVYRTELYTDPRQSSALSWSVMSISDLYDLRIWHHKMRGRWKQFWAPSWRSDITVTADIASTDTQIEIAETNYNDNFPPVADFVLITTSGEYYYFRVTDSDLGDPGKEVLTLSGEFGSNVSLGGILKVSRLILSRFDSDRIEIRHGKAGYADLSVPIIEVPI